MVGMSLPPTEHIFQAHLKIRKYGQDVGLLSLSDSKITESYGHKNVMFLLTALLVI